MILAIVSGLVGFGVGFAVSYRAGHRAGFASGARFYQGATIEFKASVDPAFEAQLKRDIDPGSESHLG